MSRTAPIFPTPLLRSFARDGARYYVLAGGAYVLLYVLIVWLSSVRPGPNLGITPWNPQAGLTLAFLLAFGPRWAPVTAVAAVFAEMLFRKSGTSPAAMVAASIWIALTYGAL